LSKGCTCSAIDVDKKTILTGDSCTVTISISLAGRYSQQSIPSAIIFDEKDGVLPAKFLITGNPHARWVVKPEVIDLGLIQFSSEIQKRNVLINTTDYGINSSIDHAKCHSDVLTVNMMSSPKEESKSYMLDIRVDPNKFIGKFDEKILIFATGQEEPASFCRVVGEIYSNITVYPARLFLTPYYSPMGVVHLRQKDGKAINLISTEVLGCEPKKIEITPNNNHESQELQLAVNILGDKAESCKGNLKITLKTGDDDRTQSLNIPFLYIGKN